VVVDSTDVQFIHTATENDAQFLAFAAEMNLQQIMLGTLAQEKGTILL
jgi:hypothetical protein